MSNLLRYAPKAGIDPVVLYGEQILREPCHEIEVDEFGGGTLRAISTRMVETMKAFSGIGLAGPQILLSHRVTVMTIHGKPLFACNPRILETKGEKTAWEACLSLPGAQTNGKVVDNHAKAKRADYVKFEYQDVSGQKFVDEVSGFDARVVQHEVGHLNGELFIDLIGGASRDMVLRRFHTYVKCMKKNWRRE